VTSTPRVTIRKKNFLAVIASLGLNALAQTFHLRESTLSDFRRQLIAALPRLHRLARTIVRNGQDGDDLFQRTIERILERSAGWQPGSRLDLWAARIMKNIWLDELRMRGRWSRLVEPMPEDGVISDLGSGADAVERQAESRRLRAMTESLPEEQRLAIKLVLLNELSYAEAAEILEIPEGTLTSRLARGRVALAKMIMEGAA
jgi:RNA polymerase sigma-70 factor (ECF subfamily)